MVGLLQQFAQLGGVRRPAAAAHFASKCECPWLRQCLVHDGGRNSANPRRRERSPARPTKTGRLPTTMDCLLRSTLLPIGSEDSAIRRGASRTLRPPPARGIPSQAGPQIPKDQAGIKSCSWRANRQHFAVNHGKKHARLHAAQILASTTVSGPRWAGSRAELPCRIRTRASTAAGRVSRNSAKRAGRCQPPRLSMPYRRDGEWIRLACPSAAVNTLLRWAQDGHR